ncbi:hypothetical protein PTI98_012245 [Pleurotus ostreatus]|uniref:Uncharacterized protein n=1 Tax=Pleurotus ostreatus (strain PC15) TaxID=1137138 RepID=A0A067NIL2_PLEO1|nr:hypothetical protein PTI98_012245 [Pleurotus ostreatus]KDQ23611.1 hypothetical protein PLEOSDRAFT_1108100 [Pleurotus ostreatus PC15]
MSSPLFGLRRRRSLLHHSNSSALSSKATASSFAVVSPILGPMDSIPSPTNDELLHDGEVDDAQSTSDTDSESSDADPDLGEDGEDGDGATNNGGTSHRPSAALNEGERGSGNEIRVENGNGSTKSSPTPKRHVRINSPPRVDTQVPHRRPTRNDPPSPTSQNRRAWYEFDLAVVVALVSPIGSWLTGGDHVKNLLLVSLLIFYLHQVVEVPWSLYHACRARHKIAAHSAGAPTKSAASALLSLELFFLALTVLSPLFGALLLRIVGNAIVGPDALSWFNVTLFVLATGLRPWRHLVDRVAGAAEEMQGIVCEGACGGRCQSPSETEEQQRLEEQRAQQSDILLHRLEAMEAELSKLKTRMSVRQDELYDYVDEAVDAVDRRVTDTESRLVRTMHDVDEVGAYIRHWGRSYSATYLDILPKWIARTLALPFSSQNQHSPSANGKKEHIQQQHHHHHSGSSANTLRTVSYKSATNHVTTPYSSMYASPNGSTATIYSKKLEPIPEEDSSPPPPTPHANGISSPTIIRSSDVPPSNPIEFIGSLVFLPFRIVRGVVSWSTGYVYGP